MATNQNIISALQNIGGQTIGTDKFFEVRVENDSQGNPLFAAWSPTPNASIDEPLWFVVKMHYDANVFLERVQMPKDGLGFIYKYSLRNFYFE